MVSKKKGHRKTGCSTNTMLTTFITYENKGEIQTREIKGFRELGSINRTEYTK
jgi:hypothetical protein